MAGWGGVGPRGNIRPFLPGQVQNKHVFQDEVVAAAMHKELTACGPTHPKACHRVAVQTNIASISEELHNQLHAQLIKG